MKLFYQAVNLRCFITNCSDSRFFSSRKLIFAASFVMKALFPTSYFPPISYMAALLREENPLIEIYETYPKQTYRNRCIVMTANGVHSLSVPVSKPFGNRTKTAEIQISYQTPWQQIHKRTLLSAYKATPYFDHYFPRFERFFDKETTNLIDLNNKILSELLKILKVEKSIDFTTDYIKNVHEITDYRTVFNPKKGLAANYFPVYYQAFCEKYPFAPNLSILDLIFNEGPLASIYLKQLNINSFQE